MKAPEEWWSAVDPGPTTVEGAQFAPEVCMSREEYIELVKRVQEDAAPRWRQLWSEKPAAGERVLLRASGCGVIACSYSASSKRWISHENEGFSREAGMNDLWMPMP